MVLELQYQWYFKLKSRDPGLSRVRHNLGSQKQKVDPGQAGRRCLQNTFDG